jgi:hypothetical protein
LVQVGVFVAPVVRTAGRTVGRTARRRRKNEGFVSVIAFQTGALLLA